MICAPEIVCDGPPSRSNISSSHTVCLGLIAEVSDADNSINRLQDEWRIRRPLKKRVIPDLEFLFQEAAYAGGELLSGMMV